MGGHCHALVDGGVAVVVGVGVVLVIFLGFTVTLLGQDKFGGLFALYLGAVVVGVLSFCSEELVAAVGVVVVVLGAVVAGNVDLAGGFDLSKVTVGPGPSYGSSEAGLLLNNLIMSCDKPIGLFGAGGCGPVRVLGIDELLGAVVGDVALADVCGPVRALEEVLGADVVGVELVRGCGPFRGPLDVLGAALGKKLSEVSMTGENLIFVCLASLHDSFSSFSSSEL